MKKLFQPGNYRIVWDISDNDILDATSENENINIRIRVKGESKQIVYDKKEVLLKELIKNVERDDFIMVNNEKVFVNDISPDENSSDDRNKSIKPQDKSSELKKGLHHLRESVKQLNEALNKWEETNKETSVGIKVYHLKPYRTKLEKNQGVSNEDILTVYGLIGEDVHNVHSSKREFLKDQTPFGKLVGEAHSHPGEYADPPSPGDIHNMLDNIDKVGYFSLVETGPARFALVIEDAEKTKEFFKKYADRDDFNGTIFGLAGKELETILATPDPGLTGEEATMIARTRVVTSILKNSGIGFYIADDEQKIDFIRG